MIQWEKDELLIVPYGIETEIHSTSTWIQKLLIVPYGIETAENDRMALQNKLLIVPYGIETISCFLWLVEPVHF